MAAKRFNDRRNKHGHVASLHALTLTRGISFPDLCMIGGGQSAFSSAGSFKSHALADKIAA